MFHIASLSGRRMCGEFSYSIGGGVGVGSRQLIVLYTQYCPAYAVYIQGCAVNVLILEMLSAVTK